MAQLRSVTCQVWSHSITCYPTQVNTPALTPAIQAGTRFTYPGGMEGWVDLVDLIAPRPGVEPATFRSRVRRSTNATTKTTCLCLSVSLTVCLYVSVYSISSLLGQDLVSDIFDKIHFFVQMDSWHDDTYPIKIWSSFVQPKWIYLTVPKPRMSVGQESCRARTSYVPPILQQHA